jgi:hypothetical protein
MTLELSQTLKTFLSEHPDIYGVDLVILPPEAAPKTHALSLSIRNVAGMLVAVSSPDMITEEELAPDMIKGIEMMLPEAIRKIESGLPLGPGGGAFPEGLVNPYPGQKKAYLN